MKGTQPKSFHWPKAFNGFLGRNAATFCEEEAKARAKHQTVARCNWGLLIFLPRMNAWNCDACIFRIFQFVYVWVTSSHLVFDWRFTDRGLGKWISLPLKVQALMQLASFFVNISYFASSRITLREKERGREKKAPHSINNLGDEREALFSLTQWSRGKKYRGEKKKNVKKPLCEWGGGSRLFKGGKRSSTENKGIDKSCSFLFLNPGVAASFKKSSPLWLFFAP